MNIINIINIIIIFNVVIIMNIIHIIIIIIYYYLRSLTLVPWVGIVSEGVNDIRKKLEIFPIINLGLQHLAGKILQYLCKQNVEISCEIFKSFQPGDVDL